MYCSREERSRRSSPRDDIIIKAKYRAVLANDLICVFVPRNDLGVAQPLLDVFFHLRDATQTAQRIFAPLFDMWVHGLG